MPDGNLRVTRIRNQYGLCLGNVRFGSVAAPCNSLNPSTRAAGFGPIADIISVECRPIKGGNPITIKTFGSQRRYNSQDVIDDDINRNTCDAVVA